MWLKVETVLNLFVIASREFTPPPNEWIKREVFIYQPTTFYHNGITHVRSIIKTIKKIEHTNHKTGEVTNSTRVQFCIANFKESAEFFHDKILHHWKIETMHQYKDNALLEDVHVS